MDNIHYLIKYIYRKKIMLKNKTNPFIMIILFIYINNISDQTLMILTEVQVCYRI